MHLQCATRGIEAASDRATREGKQTSEKQAAVLKLTAQIRHRHIYVVGQYYRFTMRFNSTIQLLIVRSWNLHQIRLEDLKLAADLC